MSKTWKLLQGLKRSYYASVCVFAGGLPRMETWKKQDKLQHCFGFGVRV